MQTLHFSNKKCSKILGIPSFGLTLVLLVCLASPISSCMEQEKGALLQFLAELSQDGGLAASWQNGTDCCKWEGITCRQDGTVTAVLLPSKGLEGHISQSLGILIGLQYLDLSGNSLSGGLPLELLSSSSITTLDVSFNQLNGTLQELPSSTPGRPLQVLNISSNLFAGQFPSTTWKTMENLIAINASNNSFTGQIPTQLCSTSPSLALLDLCFNKFSGSIPPGLGDCSKLRELRAGYNNLGGTLPDELFNATSLEHLSFPNNGLHGAIDGTNIANLRNLVVLDLGRNNFSGKIPDYIGQLKRLEEFHLGNNNMSGKLPSSLSNCTNLIIVDLKSNNLSGELTKVNFSNLPNLKTLDLWLNSFTGTVPESLYSCSNLTALRLSSNNLHGQLSSRIGNLKYLSFLSLGKNNFTNITNAIQILKSSTNLTTLLIRNNFRGERMPEDDIIDGFENLQVLSIGGCQLYGTIPLWISRLRNLGMLLLNSNQLTGPIPGWINSLSHLFFVDVSNNSLTGETPLTLMEMPMLKSTENATHLDPRIFELPVYDGPSLQYRVVTSFPTMLNLSNNNFTGLIPEQIGQLKVLALLDLSFNKLSGQIPQSICNLTKLQLLDLSSNNLTGAIPAELNSLNFLSAFNISNNDLEGPIPSGGQFNTFQNSSFDGNPKLCGSVLTHKCGSDSLSMGNSRFLVYSYMENGSLDDWLHNKDDDASSSLDWPTRLKIAKGASLGLSHIHDVCNPQIVHRDIKSSNILLDKEFKAYVADFGLARLILPNQTHVTTELVGTMGYIPPEYGQAWVATLRGDMYSFGVVLLELLTGMRPVPVLSTSKELVPWVLQMRSEERQVEVLDPTLRGTGYEEQMLKVLEAACKCVDQNQFSRPTVMEVVSCLVNIGI
uniref:non-specific serine/threonine protein kinase n=1 Tax=Aegilops tauschii subsp. strangulata TaxID=200361 RepID=A0A453NCW3_AEGTS